MWNVGWNYFNKVIKQEPDWLFKIYLSYVKGYKFKVLDIRSFANFILQGNSPILKKKRNQKSILLNVCSAGLVNITT